MRRSLFIISLIVVWALSAGAAQAETVYFLVGEKGAPHYNDSYVLPLSEWEDIRHARHLIGNLEGTPEKIVCATVVASNPDALNRNYVAEGLPVWSWSVDEFLGFAENTVEIMDGYPTGLEESMGMWSTRVIGFWGYTVVAEIGTEADIEAWNCDLSADDIIDLKDFSIFAEDWLEAKHWGADIDGSYSVDFADLAIMASHWLESPGPYWWEW